MKNVVMARLMAEGHVIQKASPSVLLSLLGHSLQRSLQKTVSSPETQHLVLGRPIPRAQRL